MNSPFTIEDTLPNKISYYQILFFLVTLPFDRFYCEVILASFAIHTLIHLKRAALKNIWTKEVLLLQSVYLVTLFGTIYTLNTKQAISDWGRQLVLFIFPILFAMSSFEFTRYRNQLLLGYSLSFTLVIVYLYFDALHIIYYNHFPLATLLSPYFLNHNFSAPIDMHATYLSLYVALALNFFIWRFFKSSSAKEKILPAVCICLLTCGLIQLASKSVMVAELLVVNFLLPFSFFRKKSRIKIAVASLAVTTILLAGVINIGSLKERYLYEFTNDLTSAPLNETADSRMERWSVALDIIKASPVVGYGSGDEVDLLKEKYFEHKLYDSYLHRLNAHNQYLSFLIKGGLIGLLVYAVTLLYGLFISLKTKDFLFTSFLIIVAIVSLSESFLDANKGVFFYGFFFSFFIFYHYRSGKTTAYF